MPLTINPKIQSIVITAAIAKYIKAPYKASLDYESYVLGKMRRIITRIIPIEAPERPIPVIAAPVYFPGIIPVIPYTLAYKMAIITPIKMTITISMT